VSRLANEHVAELRRAYDYDAPRRDTNVFTGWRREIVDDLLARLRSGASILELGGGAGQAADYVAGHGFRVVVMDLSPANVANAVGRGIEAKVGDFTDPDFQVGEFDAVFALNSLIHVPKPLYPQTLATVRRSLHPGGIALIVNWGGYNHEGQVDGEWTDPPRFFAFYSDDDFMRLPTPGFTVIERRILPDDEEAELRPHVLLMQAT
jgi:SAM-dependent methyltransferase